MARMLSKVALERIPSLTFYKDELTLSKRGGPIPQLTCVGKTCNLYQPDVVRCTNAGGRGTDVDWKCEADLPEALRFGRVEVSCEGWSGPGDPYVLKGSCGLEYRLVQIPDALRKPEEYRHHSRILNWIEAAQENPSAAVFTIVWTSCLLFILYSFLKSCLGSRTGGGASSSGTRPRPPGDSSGSGWFSGGGFAPDTNDAPPPYSKYPTGSTPGVGAAAGGGGLNPGFWTGAALGGLGTYLFNRGQRERERERVYTRPATYDWEHDRLFRSSPSAPFGASQRDSGSGFGRRPGFSSDDRGEGSSNLGSMRRSTGLGGSNVR